MTRGMLTVVKQFPLTPRGMYQLLDMVVVALLNMKIKNKYHLMGVKIKI